jgi:ABC-type ATPase involved in cell division
MILRSTSKKDAFTDYASKCFDFDFDGECVTEIKEMPTPPENFSIGVIYGSSGSGKSTLLRHHFGDPQNVEWDRSKGIVSHFKTPEDAIERLSSVGLNSVPSWVRPFHVLSNGEQFRANLARAIGDGAVVDEFTSVVNRTVAKSASIALCKMVKRKEYKNIVIATCHSDVLEWLTPDWTYNTDTLEMSVGRYHRRPTIRFRIFEAHHGLWKAFSRHHYLSQDLNLACKCFKAVMDKEVIGFSASLSLPGRIPPLYIGDKRNKFRESRTVILPDYQGIGIGVRFSDAIGEYWLNEGYRYFSKTAHIRMGEYRQKSDLWRPTSTNLKSREKSQQRSKKEMWYHLSLDTKRLCYSHEYIGHPNNPHRIMYQRKGKDEIVRHLQTRRVG